MQFGSKLNDLDSGRQRWWGNKAQVLLWNGFAAVVEGDILQQITCMNRERRGGGEAIYFAKK